MIACEELRTYRPSEIAHARHVYVTAWTELALSLGLPLDRFDPATTPLHPTAMAWIDGRGVGLVQVRRREVQRLYVLPEFQGRGLGNRLLARAESEGARTLIVDERNEQARRLYERRGWIPTGQAPSFFPESKCVAYSLTR